MGWKNINGGDIQFPKFDINQIVPGCEEGGIDSGQKFIAYNTWLAQVNDYYKSG